MKKHIKQTLCALTAACQIFALASCNSQKNGEKIPENSLVIVQNGATEYRIVRSDTNDIGGSAAAKMKTEMEKITDEKVTIMSDFEHEKLGTMRTDYEILIGPTNREESSMHEREFTYYDYAIDADTTKISVTGGSSEAIVNAVEYLAKNCFFQDSKNFYVPKGTVYEYKHDYPLKKITIGGRNLEDYVIVTAVGDERAAKFAEQFNYVYGKAPQTVNPGYKNESECEIILSSAGDKRYTEIFGSMEEFEYAYKIDGTKVYIGTNGEFDDEPAWNAFVSDIFGENIAALSGEIELTNQNSASYKMPSAEKTVATEEFLQSVEEKSAALKNSILNSPNIKISNEATVFYVSPNGNDSNDGKTPETAWQTLSKVNDTPYSANTYVLFERGGVWRGQISAKQGVTYSAYGDETLPKPSLYGGPEDGAKSENWTLMEGTDNIWIYYLDMIDSGTLVFNGGEKVAYKEIPSYINGNYVKRDDPTVLFDIKEALDEDLDFFHKADSDIRDDMPQVSSSKGKIYLRCDKGNPGEVFESIEFVPRRNGFALVGDNVTIDNFAIKYIGAHGIGGGSRSGITVSNCEIGWIGGGIQGYNANGDTNHRATRFGNGIEIYVSCKDYTVDNCYIYQVYDAGITHQYKGETPNPVKMENVTYSNNLIENCVYSIEYFLDQTDNEEQKMSNVKIHNNIMRFCGYGWGNQRPDKGAQSHIKGWDHANPAEDFEIYDNIFDRSTNWMIHCGYTTEEFAPYFHDNTFIQFYDGLFGKYNTNPTGAAVPYGNAMLIDSRLFENRFCFITDKRTPKVRSAGRGELVDADVFDAEVAAAEAAAQAENAQNQ